MWVPDSGAALPASPAPAGAAPTHPATPRHRLRREGGAAAARGGRGGRRGGRDCEGDAPQRWPGAPPLGGSPPAARLRPRPRPGEGTGRPHCPGPPLSGAPHRGKIGTPSSAGRLGETKERGRSVPRDRSPKPGTIRASATRFLPTPTWARGRLSLRGRNPIGALTAPAPQLRSQLSWGFFGEVGAPIPQSRGLPGARHAPCLPPPQSTPPLQPTTPDVIPHPLQELIPPPTINVPQSFQYPSMQGILSSPSLRGCRPVT